MMFIEIQIFTQIGLIGATRLSQNKYIYFLYLMAPAYVLAYTPSKWNGSSKVKGKNQ